MSTTPLTVAGLPKNSQLPLTFRNEFAEGVVAVLPQPRAPARAMVERARATRDAQRWAIPEL